MLWVGILIIATFLFVYNKIKTSKAEENPVCQDFASHSSVLTPEGIPRKTVEAKPDPPKEPPLVQYQKPKSENIHLSGKTGAIIKPLSLADDRRYDYAPTAKTPPTFENAYYKLLKDSLSLHHIREIHDVVSTTWDDECLICRQPTEASDRTRLSNGNFVHNKCHTDATNRLQYSSATEIPTTEEEYDKYLRLIVVNDLWPTYPVDWEMRKRILLKHAEYTCENCGETNLPLHAHHSEPLSTGGENSLNSLTCLCEECHNEAHDGKLGLEYPHGKNRDIINEAMNTKQNIEFTYKDARGNYSKREAMPIRYTKSPQGASALRAYCLLRNEERTFIIRKMSHMKLVP